MPHLALGQPHAPRKFRLERDKRRSVV